MKRRDFAIPTDEEIAKRENMYKKAEELGIDLLKFDAGENEEGAKRDIRKAIIFLGSGKDVPPDLRERLLRRNEKNKHIL